MIASSHMISKLAYNLPLYLGETQTTQHHNHQTYMIICRWTKSSYCCRESISSICSSLKWWTPAQLLYKHSEIYFHRILCSDKPSQVLELVRQPRTRPNVYKPKTEGSKETKHHERNQTLRQSWAKPLLGNLQLLINMFQYDY